MNNGNGGADMKREAMWIWLAQKCGVASTEILPLVEYFDSIEQIYGADFDAYCESGVSERLAEDLCDKDTDAANRIIDACQKHRVGILCYDDARYPSSLRSINDPPAVLYYSGRLPDFNKGLYVATVGTRRMSEYGMRAAYKIAYEVASAGAFIVSGMALGIDGVASAAAVAAGGKTVAVLGSGIDMVYPKEHKTLMDKIMQNGVVITEYAPSTPPFGSNFPIRNRIISGLSQATVVIDADVGSGAMITAKHAILQGRDIYAVPSNIDARNSSGTNSLIRDGAQAVLCGNDIIKNYTLVYRDWLNLKRLRDAEAGSQLDPSVLDEMGVASRKESVGGRTKAPSRGVSVKSDERRVNKPTVNEKATSRVDVAISDNTENKGEDEKSIKESGHSQKRSGDNSREAVESLSEKQRRVFDEIPVDMAVTIDYLTKTGMKLGELMAALTVLEVKGLVISLPGAIYMRK